MSFVTRCPACTTQFRVVADQLKISDGWVRCGHCAEVFDASQSLQPWPAPPQDAAQVDEAPTADAALPEALTDEPVPTTAFMPAPALDADPEPEPDEPVLPEPEPEPEPESESESEAEVESVADEQAPLDEEPGAVPEPVFEPVFDPVLDAQPAPEVQADPAPQWPEQPEAGPEPAFDTDTDTDPHDVSFIRQARRRAFWARAGVRWALALASLLLVVGLALQWVLHERHRIAALRPDLAPVLQALCRPLGCAIEPLRWIDALAIESSTLVQRGAGRYGFEVVLKNASLFELAMPALELSLTDARDQLLLRRVIEPKEWSAQPGTLAPQDSRTLRLELRVDADTGRLMAGYRTVAFYP